MAKIMLTFRAILVLALAASSLVQAMQCVFCLIGCGVEPIRAHSDNIENLAICGDAFKELLKRHGGGTVIVNNPKDGISGDKFSLVGIGTVDNTTATTFSYELAKGPAAVAISCQYCQPTHAMN